MIISREDNRFDHRRLPRIVAIAAGVFMVGVGVQPLLADTAHHPTTQKQDWFEVVIDLETPRADFGEGPGYPCLNAAIGPSTHEPIGNVVADEGFKFEPITHGSVVTVTSKDDAKLTASTTEKWDGHRQVIIDFDSTLAPQKVRLGQGRLQSGMNPELSNLEGRLVVVLEPNPLPSDPGACGDDLRGQHGQHCYYQVGGQWYYFHC